MPGWYQPALPFQILLSARLGWLWMEGRLHGEEFVMIVFAQAVLGMVAAALWIWSLDRVSPPKTGHRVAEIIARTLMILLSVPALIWLGRWGLDLATG